MTVLGDVVMNADGVLHGWCWNPDAPDERLTVDILMDDEVVASLTASQPRDDLKFMKYGDGEHGFYVTMTQRIAAAAPRVISARERVSGRCFWRSKLRDFAMPAEFEQRLVAARGALRQLAHSQAVQEGIRKPPNLLGAEALAWLEEELRSFGGPGIATNTVTLAYPAAPAFSAVFDAGTDGAAALASIRAGANVLGIEGAEIILTDGGADPRTKQFQAQLRNLKYILSPGLGAAARRNQAIAAARGERLFFLTPGTPPQAAALHELVRLAGAHPLLAGDLAEAVERIAPAQIEPWMEPGPPAPSCLRLAAPRSLFRRYGGFDTRMDDGAGLDLLDWVLRSATAGARPLACRTPWPGLGSVATSGHKPSNAHAGRCFAERWVMGHAS